MQSCCITKNRQDGRDELRNKIFIFFKKDFLKLIKFPFSYLMRGLSFVVKRAKKGCAQKCVFFKPPLSVGVDFAPL